MDETPIEELPAYHPGVEDGTVDANGEKIVYEYDESGNLVGWHKEPAEDAVVE